MGFCSITLRRGCPPTFGKLVDTTAVFSTWAMSGFLFSLKKNAGGVEKKKPSTGLRLNLAKPPAKQKHLQVMDDSDESDEEGKITAIDGFDSESGGGLTGNIAISVKNTKPLVITPVNLRKGLVDRSKESLQKKIDEEKSCKLQYGITEFRDDAEPDSKRTSTPTPQPMSEDDRIRQSLISGRLYNEKKLVIPMDDKFRQSIEDAPDEDSDQEYEKVPVEQFGAAMLRGMGGGVSTDEPKTSSILSHRQRGQLLGIGSKPLESDLMEDIMGKRGSKLDVPLVKRDKTTGELVRD